MAAATPLLPASMLAWTVFARRLSLSCSSSGAEIAASASAICAMTTSTRSVSAAVTPLAASAATRRLPGHPSPGELRGIFGVDPCRGVQLGAPFVQFALVELPVIVEALQADGRQLPEVVVLERLRQLHDATGEFIETRAELRAGVLAPGPLQHVLGKALVHVRADRDVTRRNRLDGRCGGCPIGRSACRRGRLGRYGGQAGQRGAGKPRSEQQQQGGDQPGQVRGGRRKGLSGHRRGVSGNGGYARIVASVPAQSYGAHERRGGCSGTLAACTK